MAPAASEGLTEPIYCSMPGIDFPSVNGHDRRRGRVGGEGNLNRGEVFPFFLPSYSRRIDILRCSAAEVVNATGMNLVLSGDSKISRACLYRI